MINQIKANITQMQTLGLDHCKLSTEDEGLTWPEIGERIAIMRECDLPVWVKIGGCEAIGDIRMCKAYGVAGIVAPMIESEFAVFKFTIAIEKEYVLNGFNRPELSINIESKAAINNFIDLCRDKTIKIYTIGRRDLAGSVGYSINSSVIKSMVREVKHVLTKYPSPLAIGGGITPATVNQVIEDYQPNYVQTRNFCFSLSRNPALFHYGNQCACTDEKACVKLKDDLWLIKNRASNAITLALETEILMLKYFNHGNEQRIEELGKRLT